MEETERGRITVDGGALGFLIIDEGVVAEIVGAVPDGVDSVISSQGRVEERLVGGRVDVIRLVSEESRDLVAVQVGEVCIDGGEPARCELVGAHGTRDRVVVEVDLLVTVLHNVTGPDAATVGGTEGFRAKVADRRSGTLVVDEVTETALVSVGVTEGDKAVELRLLPCCGTSWGNDRCGASGRSRSGGCGRRVRSAGVGEGRVRMLRVEARSWPDAEGTDRAGGGKDCEGRRTHGVLILTFFKMQVYRSSAKRGCRFPSYTHELQLSPPDDQNFSMACRNSLGPSGSWLKVKAEKRSRFVS